MALAEKISELETVFKKVYLIIGASSGIAQATLSTLAKSSDNLIVAISRKYPKNDNTKSSDHNNIIRVTCDYSETSIERIITQLALANLNIDIIYIFNGMLHDSSIKPEKQLQQFNAEHFQKIISVNTLVPMKWLSVLYRLLNKKSEAYIVILSARVGSIEDNKLGGWYSYRASKAALNMLIKTASIEYKRHAKGVKLIAFHPGTTDTALSKPFQKNVPAEKLFSPTFVGQQLCNIRQAPLSDNTVDYIDWQYKTIKW